MLPKILLLLFISWSLVLYVFGLYFGSNSRGKSHIITPQRVDKSGVPMTPSVHQHRVRPRHRNINDIHYKINLEGRNYQLDLQLDNKLQNPTILRHVGNKHGRNASKVVTNYQQKPCHYVGVVKNFPKSKVAISNCDGLMGYIFLNSTLYLIEPIRNNASKLKDSDPHMLYEERTKKKEATCGIQNNKMPDPSRKFRSSPNQNEEKTLFDHNPGHLRNLYIEITLVLDRTLIDWHRSIDLESYMITIMNVANAAMSDTSFGAPAELALVRMIRLEQEDEELNLIMSPDSVAVLKVLEAWQMKLNPTYDTHPDHHDMAILVTRVDICLENHPYNCGLLGSTRMGKLCDPLYSAMVAEDNGLALGYTIAHEIGHAMGMAHDNPEESGCLEEPYGDGYTVMMAEGVDLKTWGWSNCSREYLWAWLDTGQGECLYDVPTSDRYPLGTILPGAAFGIHYQCRFLFGHHTSECVDEAIECHNMKCLVDDEGCIHTLLPLADGTECGEHRWCFRGNCINKGSRPEAIDGGWSEWGAWSPCSRTCGGGVSRSVRYCDHPKPANRGIYCTGRRVRYQICNTDLCPHGQPSFREVQCNEFNGMLYPVTNATHTWSAIYTIKENPCELICKNENGRRSIMKTQVTDGTPCYIGENYLCISGACKRVPCDHVLDSPAVEDACGVCHGDGSSCEIHSEEMHFSKKNKYQLVKNLKKNTRFAVIEETYPTSSEIQIISNEEQKLLVSKKFGITMIDNTRVWVGQPKIDQDVIKIRGPLSQDLGIYVGAIDEVTIKITVAIYKPSGQGQPEFKWQKIDWGECSEPCGAGTQISEAKCLDQINGIVEDKYCNGIEKPPPESRLCELRECEPRWQVGEWSGCECVCEDQNSDMQEERAVDCVRRAGNHEEIIVSDDLCDLPKPPSLRTCICYPKPDGQTKKRKREDLKHAIAHMMPGAPNNKTPHKTYQSKSHQGVLERTHLQNIHEQEQIRGSLVVDYANLDDIDFALEVDRGSNSHRSKNFPRPKNNQNLVHLRGRSAINYLWKIQKRNHLNSTGY